MKMVQYQKFYLLLFCLLIIQL